MAKEKDKVKPYAEWYMGQILKIKYQDELLSAEKEAREKRVGVWKK